VTKRKGGRGGLPASGPAIKAISRVGPKRERPSSVETRRKKKGGEKRKNRKILKTSPLKKPAEREKTGTRNPRPR